MFRLTDISQGSSSDILLRILFFVVIFYAALPILGFVADLLERGLFFLLSRFANRRIALFVCNRFTFMGTILHELSHALFIILTGGEVLHISCFDVFRGDSLGHVDFALRGGRIQRSFQLTLGSAAPTIVLGTILFSLLFYVWSFCFLWWHYAVVVYGIFSCICHMSMSFTDIKNYFRGLPVVLPISYLIVFVCVWLSVVLV